MFIEATWLLDYPIIAYEQGICLLAWMGWNADIEGRGLGELCTYDEINPCSYDLSKPLTLQETRGRLTVPADFFFNNDLEYLSRGSTGRKYLASTTKTKVAKYEIERIEDMVPKLWSPIKLNNLDDNVTVHLAVGLRMYTQRIVIQSRVEDLQLG
ncbi:hypothetical protein Tco_1405765 [Tanacetum coccineum]